MPMRRSPSRTSPIISALQAGFRQWREITPTAFLRRARLQLAHGALLRSGKEANVRTVAWLHGFSHPLEVQRPVPFGFWRRSQRDFAPRSRGISPEE
jgi:AraC-like DNA-binding protein